MAPKHTTGGPRAHYPGINKVAPAHAIGGSHRSEYSFKMWPEGYVGQILRSTHKQDHHQEEVHPDV